MIGRRRLRAGGVHFAISPSPPPGWDKRGEACCSQLARELVRKDLEGRINTVEGRKEGRKEGIEG